MLGDRQLCHECHFGNGEPKPAVVTREEVEAKIKAFNAPKPRRCYEIELKLSADSWQDLTDALDNIRRSLIIEGQRERLSTVSGGYNSGYVLTGTRDDSWTHDRYVEAINAEVARGK